VLAGDQARLFSEDHDRLLDSRLVVTHSTVTHTLTRQIFFRFIKQNLKIKAFIGNSENAVLTQIYAALIVYLLLCYLKFLCNLTITLQNCIRILQLNLFRTCTLQELFEPPEMITDNMCHPKQLT